MNRAMVAKAAKAKKAARQYVLECDQNEACATKIVPQDNSVLWNIRHKPFSVVGGMSVTH